MIQNILFDMDGLLVDTEPLFCLSSIQTLKKFGIGISEQEYYEHWTRKGRSIIDFADERRLSLNIKKYRKLRDEFYFDLLEKRLKTIESVPEKVAELAGKYKLGLVSSSARKHVDRILEKTKLRSYFQVTVSCDEVKKVKPDPESFLLASKLLNAKPEECLVLEDAEKGIVAAKRAGMKVIAIPNSATKGNDFSAADLVLKSMSKLNRKVIESLSRD